MADAIVNLAARSENTMGKFTMAAEKHGVAGDRRFQSGHPWIVGVQDGKILPALVAENLSLSLGVGFQTRVPVQVVGRKVEHHRHVGAEFVNAFQLKAAQLGDKPRTGWAVSTAKLKALPMLPPT